jgi:hypothetical protein
MIAAVALLASAALATNASAQEAEPAYVVLEEMRVLPDRAADLEAAMKAFLPVLAEHGFPNLFYGHVGDDLTYYFTSPAASMADVDRQRRAWVDFMAKVGMDTIGPLMEAFNGTYELSRQSMWRHRPDLSYASDPPRWDPTEATFRFWGFMYVKPGMEPQIEAVLRKYVELFSAKKLAWGWQTYVGEFGAETPVYVYTEIGPSLGEFHTEGDKISKQLGEQGDALWTEALAAMRRFEPVRSDYRADLSFIPESAEPAPGE